MPRRSAQPRTVQRDCQLSRAHCLVRWASWRGAFAAHALRGRVPPEALALVDTASRYQLIHALALIAAGVLHLIRPSFAARLSAACFAAGALLFCGSLYSLAFGAPRALGMIAPIGGVLLIAGWLALAISAWRSPARALDDAH